MRGLVFNKRNMDGANEFAGGKVVDPMSRHIIAMANEHAVKRFG
jgi:hypothetical protein